MDSRALDFACGLVEEASAVFGSWVSWERWARVLEDKAFEVSFSLGSSQSSVREGLVLEAEVAVQSCQAGQTWAYPRMLNNTILSLG